MQRAYYRTTARASRTGAALGTEAVNTVDNVYTLAKQWRKVNGGIEFDWDAGNVRHLIIHRVTRNGFEELMTGDPDYLEYQAGSDEETEERYKVLGATKAARVLIGVWTPREGRVRAVTACDAGPVYRNLYWETRG